MKKKDILKAPINVKSFNQMNDFHFMIDMIKNQFKDIKAFETEVPEMINLLRIEFDCIIKSNQNLGKDSFGKMIEHITEKWI